MTSTLTKNTASFDYIPVGGVTQTVKVSLVRLATNVITDWVPGVPNSISRGLADLLSRILKAETTPQSAADTWIVQSQVHGFEKQWKNATSWMLGVAFCRWVIEQEGYAWWAPVSAFTRAKNKTPVARHKWLDKKFSVNDCYVQPPPIPTSNLLPDYILARQKGGTPRYEISFAESKGGDHNVAGSGWASSPGTWTDQCLNAVLYRRRKTPPDTKISAKQRLVVATRVNTKGKRAYTRRIQVRAWNSKNLETIEAEDAFREVLAMHYFGVCEQIGFSANAFLIASELRLRGIQNRLYSLEDDRNTPGRDSLLEQLQREAAEMREEQARVADDAGSELEPRRVVAVREAVFVNPDVAPYATDAGGVRVGLSASALDTVRWLQGRNDNFNPDSLYHMEGEARESSVAEAITGVAYRNDGVVGILGRAVDGR
jgi:hypothetical protein